MSTETGVQLRPILLTWEKLRIVYNIVLAGVTVAGLATRPDHPIQETWFPAFIICCWVGANLCFCAGPLLEVYVNYLADRRIAMTWWLFFPGMFLSMLLAFVISATWALGDLFW